MRSRERMSPPAVASPPATRSVVLGALLFVAVATVYSCTLTHGFIWDDDLHVTANPAIVGPLGLQEIWTTAAANYFPLVLTNFWVQHALWGLQPFGYHAVTIACHALCAVLLWRVLLALGVPGAWLGAALWALHPVQVESVAWISELKNTQSGTFFLLSILFWVRWQRLPTAESEATVASRRNYAVALACGLCALLSKPSTVMLPVALALIVWWRRGALRWRDAVALAPFFALSAVASGWAIWEQKFHSGALGAEWSQSFVERLALAGKIAWFYLGKLIWPHPLAFIYPRWATAATPLAFLPLAAMLAGLAVLWWPFRPAQGPELAEGRRERWRPALVTAVFFIALLFPVLGFFDVYFFCYSFVGDHFQYLASMGPLVLFAAGLAVASPRVLPVTGGVAVLAFATLTVMQCGDYRSRETLWRATLARNPGSAMAWDQLGSEFQRASRHREATDCFQRALKLNPRHPEALNHLGVEFLFAGRIDDAIAELQRAVEARRGFPEAHSNLGLALMQAGRAADALLHFESVARSWPTLAEAHSNLATALRALDRSSEAVAHYEAALTLDRNYPGLHEHLGAALVETGRAAEAVPHYERALQFEPNRSDLHDDFGRALAAAGRTNDAIAQYERAIQLNPGLAVAHNDLGVSLAQLGRFPDALARFDEAVRLDVGYATAHTNRGGALAALGRLPEACDAFARAVQLQPNSAKAHTHLAQLLRALGRESEAREHFDQAARLEVTAPRAH